MDGLRALLESKKAIFSGLLVLAASVLAVLKIMTLQEWIDFTKWLAVTYVGAEGLDSGLGKLGAAMSMKKMGK
jgi:hypothetical protein